uniref:Ribosomal protein L6 n=1 Tax=Tsukubamonas globosa TaxID=875863 RepID=W8VTG6_9EUKA|nr:ribosomal protein L6 [Tsukubamonas globosa]BAO51958.1 ribosomal protein L6 [Tsukubamonas globosa]
MKKLKSNVGKQPIVCSDVTILKNNGQFLIKGKYGLLQLIQASIFTYTIKKEDAQLSFFPKTTLPVSSLYSSIWGTYRTLFYKAVLGVQQGYKQQVELVGIGYKGTVENNNVVLKLGKSHEVIVKKPDNVKVRFLTTNLLLLRSINLQNVRQFAFQLYKLKKPDPYKGKGIRIPNVVLYRKEGKKQK